MKDKMEICASCGAIAPSGNYQCTRCHIPLADNRIVVPLPEDELICARLHGVFTCRSCGHDVPLNAFSLHGYECAGCHTEQRFDWGFWGDIVKSAHNVADLCGFDQPDATDPVFWQAFKDTEGEEQMRLFRSIGRNSSVITKENGNPNLARYNMEISPGNPVCIPCRVPLKIEVVEGCLQTHCTECDAVANYVLSSGLDEYSWLFACISDGHRVENHHPTGTALPPSDAPAAWWMVFQGPSTLRRKIERLMRRQNEARVKMDREVDQQQALAQRKQSRLKSRFRARDALILLAVGATTVLLTWIILRHL